MAKPGQLKHNALCLLLGLLLKDGFYSTLLRPYVANWVGSGRSHLRLYNGNYIPKADIRESISEGLCGDEKSFKGVIQATLVKHCKQ